MDAFITWWQHLPEHISPVIFEIGPFRLQYYGLMYLVAFAITYLLVCYRLKHESRFTISIEQTQGLMFAIVLGLMIGARLGYVLFYNAGYYFRHPLEIILPFQFEGGITFTGISGMSYHGGLIGVLAGTWLYLRRAGCSFREALDLFVPAVPLGYTFGRLGNFINGELFGRPTDAPIGMHFPLSADPGLRHPSQLYEAFFEGIFLFVILWTTRKKQRIPGASLAYYLLGYGIVRFFIEFFREPDPQLGFVLGPFSMGQILCGLMILAGTGLYLYLRRIDTKS